MKQSFSGFILASMLVCSSAIAQIPTNGLIAYYPFNGNVNDESGNANNVISNSAIITTDRFGNPIQAYAFDGTASYMKVSYSTGLNPTTGITLSAWVNATDFYPGLSSGNYIISKGYDSNIGKYCLGYLTESRKFVFQIRFADEGAVFPSETLSSSIINPNAWYHVVGTFDGNTMKIFINGVEENQTLKTALLPVNTEDLYIGMHNEPGYPYYVNGKIDDIRIYDHALIAPEIDALYHEGGWPQQTPVNDVDGNTYNTVQIGSQVWMQENLKTTKYNDNSPIPLITDNVQWTTLTTPGFTWYNNDSVANKNPYGALYNWYVVNSGILCPIGWHVPSDAEWETLEIYLGMTQLEADGTSWRGTDQGAQLKNTSGWDSGGNGTNTSGFSALPGGARSDNSIFLDIGSSGHWWSSTESSNLIWRRFLAYDKNLIWKGLNSKGDGVSVRCLKNDIASVVLPSLATQNIFGITSSSATVGTLITSDGGAPVTARGVCWSTTTNPDISGNKTIDGAGIGGFPSFITGLTENTTYFVRSYATNSAGTAYSTEVSFGSSSAITVTDMDGNNYQTVKIGPQLWMKENLKTTKYSDGSSIPEVSDDAGWQALSTPGFSWYNYDSASNFASNGALYNWYAVNTGKLCPTGWEVPSDNTWKTLEMNLGLTLAEADAIGMRGTDQGSQLKNSSGWNSGQNGTNSSGFSANPSGMRFDYGLFSAIGLSTAWWTSTVDGNSKIIYRTLSGGNASGRDNNYDSRTGFSIRCVKTELNTGPIAYFSFNGSAIDESGNGNNGTVSGATLTKDRFGALNSAYDLNGNDLNRITLSPFIPPSLISISIWFNPTDDGPTTGNQGSVMFSNIENSINHDAIAIYMYGGKLVFCMANSGSTGFYVESNNPITLNHWHHVVAVIDDQKQLRMYLDNVLQEQTTYWSGSYSGQTVTNIGNNVNDNDNFDGSLDDIRIYNRALNVFEINSLYHEGGWPLATSLTDIDGNVYNTVQIGTQVWMKENLKTTKFNDGSQIPKVTVDASWAALSTPGFTWYYNDSATYNSTYGALYNAFVINTGKLCPSGWHVPSDAEWTTLTDNLGGSSLAGGKMKEAGFDHWITPNLEATNESGFSALPAGYRTFDGAFTLNGYHGGWWSVTPQSANSSWYRGLNYDQASVFRTNGQWQTGFSVRCLRDEAGTIIWPVLVIKNIIDVTSNSAIISCNILSDGGSPITSRGVCWSKLSNPTIADLKTSDGAGLGIYSSTISGLTPGTKYFVRPYATNINGTEYGNEISFVANASCETQFEYLSTDSVRFTDVSIGNPTAWSWDFGDGSYSVLQNPAHKYSRNGEYTVTLNTINKLSNCVSSQTKNVVAGNIFCQADFDAIVNAVTGLTAFTSKSTNASGYYWDFGNGIFSTLANPFFTFSKAGIYPVCLTVFNESGACQSVICKNIMFIPSGTNYIQADFSFYTDPATGLVTFSDLSTANTTDWYWTMGDGKVLNSRNPVYTYTKAGVYKVCLTVFDKINSLSNSICKDVVVGNIPCNISSEFGFFINPLARDVTFTNKSKGTITDYFWTFGDGSSSSQENPSHHFTVPGYYEITLAVRNSSTECIGTSKQFIQVGSVDCHSDFIYRVDHDILSVSFTDNSQGAVAYYYWDLGDGSFSVMANPGHIYKEAGNYLVGLTVIDAVNGCIDMSAQTVQVGEINCAADFACYIDSTASTAYFTSQVLGTSTALLWSFGDGTFSTELNPIHKFPGPGIYSAGLNTFNFSNGCMDYFQQMLLIGGMGIDCNADFIYRVDPSSNEVVFSNSSTGDIINSLWNFGDESENSDETNPVHTYANPGYYLVCLNVVNSYNIKNMGCKWVLVEGNSDNECLAEYMFTVDSANRKVTFADNSLGDIDKYTWDFGDSRADSISHEKDPVHTYDQIGYYTVKLKVENTTHSTQSSTIKLINVGDLQVLKAAFSYDALLPTKKVAGYPVDLVSASSGDGATVEWDFGDKQVKKESFTVMDSTSQRITHYYRLPGKYYVCLRISDPVSGQSDQFCDFVNTRGEVSVEDVISCKTELSVYPNPFTDITTITFLLSDLQYAELSIFDQLGRKIDTLVKSRQDKGEHSVTWDSKTNSAGIYYIKLVTSNEIITKQLIITR